MDVDPGREGGRARAVVAGFVAWGQEREEGRERRDEALAIVARGRPPVPPRRRARRDPQRGGGYRHYGREVVVVWGRAKLAGFDLASGELLFEKLFRARLLESVNAASPVIQGNRIFVSECLNKLEVLLQMLFWKSFGSLNYM